MKLSDLKENEAAVISALGDVPSGRIRLRDLGFCEGETVACLFVGAFREISVYEVKDTAVALRKGDAERIEVAL
ncbi:MAG: ferrous iron transport protein A [Clostridiales bacterium]|uniref:Ferrous iron transport protein A n=1 Tax=Candidatus Scybalenecus merdavium TaxID=2840939 RepID=A0A9D1MVC0_9FIRM|nr:ferrous iron transport protein A [Clostridiales bacterium]HIU69385.1 ferrous iron transport protein A [Candidatus Scubalenecus merdavium]